MTTRILHIDSSLFGDNGVSSQLSAYLKEKLLQQYPDAAVNYHSLAKENIPHFSLQTIVDIGDGKAALADNFIRELQEANVVLISAPMYNFAVPSQLKAWFDHVARAGVTFRYTENGPIGLLQNKKVYVVTTRGGLHKGKETDTETAWLRTMLGFLGMKDVEFIFAEALNMGGQKESSVAAAQASIDKIANSISEAA